MMSRVILHVSPHPDDEVIGAPATLMALRDAGHHIVNLAVGFGRPEVAERRRAEVREATRRAGFELIAPDPPISISADADLDAAEVAVRRRVREEIERRDPAIVVSPSPHDVHHGHEVVGRAVRGALRDVADPPSWWMWGLWGQLSFPTLFVPFGASRLREMEHALDAHVGEVTRNDYRRLLRGRGTANAVLGAELVFGFGEPARRATYAELITEVVRRDDAWWLGAPRVLDPYEPLTGASQRRADEWVELSSLGELVAPAPTD
jgi:LmbE family N-acetylglucosaminyl deacetylase